MEIYTHYGIQVIRQVINSSFTATLRGKDISYIELPIREYLVVKYTSGGSTKYALISPQHIPDDYAETVYITEQAPDDGHWDLLKVDIDRQHNDDGQPMVMQSRLKLIIDIAHHNALDSVLSDDKAALYQAMRLELVGMGYSKDDLIKADSHDVDPDMISKLINNGRSL